jgi:hypothetical protein
LLDPSMRRQAHDIAVIDLARLSRLKKILVGRLGLSLI